MKDRAARIRTGTLGPALADEAGQDPRVSVSLGGLRALADQARGLSFMSRQPPRSVLNGQHASRIRGRGLDFEELRAYLPSDDVRAIDWKVTARTGQPHVRVYTEERDRPALIVVDQRMSMFFGSTLNTKAVTAAECAALAAFRILEQGDRVGGIVFGDELIAEVRPRRSRTALDRLLMALADANALLRADAPDVQPVGINQVLDAVGRLAPRNHLVLVFSDFNATDAHTARLLSSIARHNDLVLGLVSDPLAEALPRGLKVVVSDGNMQGEIDTGDQHVYQALRAMVAGRLAEILDWQRTLGVPVLPLTTAETSLTQMRRLMGRAPR